MYKIYDDIDMNNNYRAGFWKGALIFTVGGIALLLVVGAFLV